VNKNYHFYIRLSLILFLCGIILSRSLFADSPLVGIVEYTQKVTLKCATHEEAKSVSLVPLKLPKNAGLAFSARWDDSNVQHLSTHQAMTKNGIKGTFYLNAWNNPQFGPEFCAKLLKNGCSIGAHTATHPYLPSINANQQFYEIMSVRVKIESDSDSIASTMVLPFCQYGNSADPQIQLDVGRAMMNSGYIGAPEPYYGRYEKLIGYPEGTLAESALIQPGDRDVSAQKFNETISRYLNTNGKLDNNPSMSVGIHSWHTKNGLKTLDGLLQNCAQNKDWWFCNQNEYAAYRFEARNCRIDKVAKGKLAEFTITRYTPESLGANVDLWFSVSGCQKQPQITIPLNAQLNSGLMQLPHSQEQQLPAVIARTTEDGTTDKIPGVKCTFSVTDFINVSVTLNTSNPQEMTNVICTLRTGAGFTPGVIVDTLNSISPENSYHKQWILAHADSTRYLIGKPYYVAQFDFTQKGKRHRLYAEYRADSFTNAPRIPACCIRAYLNKDNTIGEAGLIRLSKIDTTAESMNLKPIKVISPDILSENAISFSVPKEDVEDEKKSQNVILALDFVPEKYGEITLSTKADAMYLNGTTISKNKNKQWLLPVISGKNRLIICTKAERAGRWEIRYFFPKGIPIKHYLTNNHENTISK